MCRPPTGMWRAVPPPPTTFLITLSALRRARNGRFDHNCTCGNP
ncbi:hypothetical protein M3J09_008666 [Ascochyta lentis]